MARRASRAPRRRGSSSGSLDEYAAKRDFARTPEPGARSPRSRTGEPARPRFVIQEHHARRLHWDLRLERDGVLCSWAVPKGIPMRPKPNHLAVRTEDHPLEYLTFEGVIPKGQYGAGTMTVWDSGTYDLEKWTDREVMLVFCGSRVRGRYVLFRTDGKQWMIHRMDPPEDPTIGELPRDLRPMLPVATTRLPPDDDAWAYEMKWDGMRVLLTVEEGRVRATTRQGNDATARFPEFAALGRALGSTEAILDGEVVVLGDDSRPSFELLQRRMQAASERAVRTLTETTPAVVMLFDLLWLDGHSTMALPYAKRRELLERLALAGPAWQTPPATVGNGARVMAAARDLGFEGVVMKRLDSPYRPGQRSDTWRKLKVENRQELVVGGWLPGKAGLAGRLGSLLVGYHDAAGALRYAGRVGSGITSETRADLEARLHELARRTSPFADAPSLPDARWVSPKLVVEVAFHEWTRAGILRAPRFKGLRPDKDAREVIREPAASAGSD
jgi:bifunctional non-homologous end joining protein LigD